MQPMHSKIKHTSRCPCCKSNYSRGGKNARQEAKSAARLEGKRALNKQLKEV